jgi:hypothetical protein
MVGSSSGASGNGAFLRALPKGADWFEIQKGRHFLKAERRWDWAVGNPPFSWCGVLQIRWHL